VKLRNGSQNVKICFGNFAVEKPACKVQSTLPNRR
jgi:hypothetical protein